jgi:peptide/nickel transport system permease protein
MTAYVIRRLLLIFPTLLGVTLLVAAILRLLPGDVVDIMVSESAGAIDPQQLRHELGLDRGFLHFYWDWLTDILRGDFGKTFRGGRPIVDELRDRFPVTLELGLFALLISALVAIPIGVVAAIRQDTILDYISRSFAIGALALPTFWIATLAVVFAPRFFGKSFPLFYTPFWENPWANIQHVWAPALILGLAGAGPLMRLTRSQMLEVLRQDYIRTAWSKGLRERVVVLRHALKNAMIPVVTFLGLSIPALVGGSVVMESIFVLPGMGQFLMRSLLEREYLAVLAINLLVAVVVVFGNLAIDITYAYLDPRVRFGGEH